MLAYICLVVLGWSSREAAEPPMMKGTTCFLSPSSRRMTMRSRRSLTPQHNTHYSTNHASGTGTSSATGLAAGPRGGGGQGMSEGRRACSIKRGGRMPCDYRAREMTTTLTPLLPPPDNNANSSSSRSERCRAWWRRTTLSRYVR